MGARPAPAVPDGDKHTGAKQDQGAGLRYGRGVHRPCPKNWQHRRRQIARLAPHGPPGESTQTVNETRRWTNEGECQRVKREFVMIGGNGFAYPFPKIHTPHWFVPAWVIGFVPIVTGSAS
jgi:hypothetical protein